MSFRALADEFQIGQRTAIVIVREVCNAICQQMGRPQLPLPKRQQWLQNAEDFERMGFPRAIGAMDGKHFWIKVKLFSLSTYFQYFSSLVEPAPAFTITKVSFRLFCWP
jgi:hypothetical protein